MNNNGGYPWQYPRKTKEKYSARNNWKSFAQMRNGPPDNYCTPPWFAGARLEICQKIYTTGFSDQKVCNLGLFFYFFIGPRSDHSLPMSLTD